VLGLLLFRRYALSWLHRDSHANDMVGFAMSSFAMLYGILLGLIAVDVSENRADMVGIVDHEASSLAALYRDVGGLPAPVGTDLQAILRTYTRDMIDNVWPAQHKGIEPTRNTQEIDDFFAHIQAFKPAHAGEQVLMAEALRQANNLIELRRERIAEINFGVHKLIWVVVLAGAAINIMLMWMLRMARHVHVVLTAMLASFIGVVIFLAAAMDYPFRGDLAIDAEPFVMVWDSVMAADAKAAAAATVPDAG
jgi:hypothetical protein